MLGTVCNWILAKRIMIFIAATVKILLSKILEISKANWYGTFTDVMVAASSWLQILIHDHPVLSKDKILQIGRHDGMPIKQPEMHETFNLISKFNAVLLQDKRIPSYRTSAGNRLSWLELACGMRSLPMFSPVTSRGQHWQPRPSLMPAMRACVR